MPVEIRQINAPKAAQEALKSIAKDQPDSDQVMNDINDLATSGGQIYGGWFNGRWIAFAAIDKRAEIPAIRYLIVHPATRQRGVGERLLQEILEMEGCSEFLAHTHNNPSSHKFFIRAGFEESPESLPEDWLLWRAAK